jgi:hypothetical protein
MHRLRGVMGLQMQRADKTFCVTTPKSKLYTIRLESSALDLGFQMYIMQDLFVYVKALFK